MINRSLKCLIVTGLVLAVAAAPATAQVKWQVGIGPTMPMGDFGEAFNMGFHVMGGANFGLTAKPISFRADAAYHMNKCDVVAACGDVTQNMLTLSGDVVYNFPTPRTHPYLLGGLTWGNASCSGCQSSSDIGFNLGGGMHFDLGANQIFVEARYFSIDQSDFIPITVGVRF